MARIVRAVYLLLLKPHLLLLLQLSVVTRMLLPKWRLWLRRAVPRIEFVHGRQASLLPGRERRQVRLLLLLIWVLLVKVLRVLMVVRIIKWLRNAWKSLLCVLLLRVQQLLRAVLAAAVGALTIVVPLDVLLEEVHDDLVGHPVVPDEGLPAVLGHVGAALGGAGEGRGGRQPRREVLLEVLVTEMLVEGVLGAEHELAERAPDLEGLRGHRHRLLLCWRRRRLLGRRRLLWRLLLRFWCRWRRRGRSQVLLLLLKLLLLLSLLIDEMRRIRVRLVLHLLVVGVTWMRPGLCMQRLVWVHVVLRWVRRMLQLLCLMLQESRVVRLLLLEVLLSRLLLGNQCLLSLLGLPYGFGRRRLQLRGNKLADLAGQVLLHLLVHDAVVFDEGTYGLVLGLVAAPLVRALEGRHRGQLLGQLWLEVPLGEVAPEVALGLAQVAAVVALDHVRGRRRGVGVVDERVARVLSLLWDAAAAHRWARTRRRRRRRHSAPLGRMAERRHMVAHLHEVAVLRLLLEHHGALLWVASRLVVLRWLKLVGVGIATLLLLLLLLLVLLFEGKLHGIRTNHF